MKPKFVSGRKNLALTIMVPFDCPNNCPFCESKKEYAENRPNLDAVINAIKRFYRDNNMLEIPEVVITGGEPMANILALRKIINVIPSDKDIYINTTLTRHNFGAFVNLVNSHPQIKGVNVSRHSTNYNDDCRLLHNIATDEAISLIKKPVRINCVIRDRSNQFFRDVIARWDGLGVELSFRENFNSMTEKDLHNPYSHSLPFISTLPEYVGHTFCKVCDTTTFRTYKGMVVRYHKGLKNTLITLDYKKYEVNDIIIRQNGEIFCDWDFTYKTLLPTNLLHDDMKDLMARSRERMVEIATSETPKRHTCGSGGYMSHTCGGYGGCGGSSYCANISSCGGGYGGCGGGRISGGGC